MAHKTTRIWAAFLLLALLLTACHNGGGNDTTGDNSTLPGTSSAPGRTRGESNAPGISTQTEEASNSTTDILILVNKNHKLPDDYKPDLTTEGAKYDKVLSDGLSEMRAAAKKENIYLMIGSAYRTAAEQEQLFNELGPSVAAQPGYSEHQTGLAIDFSYSGLSDKETNRMWNWLADNAYKYGFILRYPKGREDITGFAYEPWHFRYVGKQAAKTIYEKGFVLEEYLEQQ